MDFILKTINRFESPTLNVSMDFHNYHELVYKFDGTGISTINSKNYKFSPGCLCIYPKNVYHNEVVTNGKNDSLVIWFEQMSDEVEIKSGVYVCDKDIQRVIERICDEQRNQDIYYLNRISNLISDLLIAVYRKDNSAKKEFEPDILGIKYIQKNYNSPLNVTELAKMSGYTRSAYCKAFKSVTGKAPQEYILNTRIENAIYNLCYSGKTVSSIATECGFYDTAQFSRLFKRFTGMTPLSYRKEFKSKEKVTQILPK